MKRETLAELIMRTVIEFEQRELELQKASLMQHKKGTNKHNQNKSKAA
ncbi:MAG: hypothetical protein QNJ51_25215 [Calothrix sp. MO_167.B12]|nr:hypothetical protein [Calothrix sp. MO_167.B12]